MSTLGSLLSEQLKSAATELPSLEKDNTIAEQEASLLSIIFKRLTTQQNDDDMLPAEVSAIFRHYASIGDKLNASSVSAANIRKLAIDVNLAGVLHTNKNKAQAIVDILYTRVVRGDAARYGILELIGESKGLCDGTTFPWFIARLGLQVWVAYLERKENSAVTTPVLTLLLPSGEEQTAAMIVEQLQRVLQHAKRLWSTNPSDEQDALSASALSALKRAEGTLQRLFYAYTTAKGTVDPAMDFTTLCKLAADFNICPGVISKPSFFACFVAASPLQTPLLFPGFLEVITRVALRAFSQSAHEDAHPTPGSKIDALLDRILAAADKLTHMAGMERQSGKTPSAPTRLLSPGTASSGGAVTARRVSIANQATAREALTGRLMESSDAQVDVERIQKRRNTVIAHSLDSARRSSTSPMSARKAGANSADFSASWGATSPGFASHSASFESVTSARKGFTTAPTALAASRIEEEKGADALHNTARTDGESATTTSPRSKAVVDGSSNMLSLLHTHKPAFSNSPSKRGSTAGALSKFARASVVELGLRGESVMSPSNAESSGDSPVKCGVSRSNVPTMNLGLLRSPSQRSIKSQLAAAASNNVGDGLGYAIPGAELAGSLASNQLLLHSNGMSVPIPLPGVAALAASMQTSRDKYALTGRTTMNQLLAAQTTLRTTRSSVSGGGQQQTVTADPRFAAAAAIIIAQQQQSSNAQAMEPLTTDQKHIKPTYVVNPQVVDRLCSQFAPYMSRIKPIFLFYCRVGDPANTGRMSYTNFFRLLKDINAIDSSVTTGDVHLQLLIIVRDNAAEAAAAAKNVAAETDVNAVGHRASTSATPTVARPLHASGKTVPVGTSDAVGLSLEDFFEALVRVSELVRRATQVDDVAVVDADEGDDDEAAAKLKAELSSATNFFHTFLVRRIMPLMDLPDAEEQIAQLVETPEVIDVLARHAPFLKRLFAFYANDQRDSIHVAVYPAEFLQMMRDFEMTPNILNKVELESIFFACARRAGTDLGQEGLMGKAGASGVGGGVGHRKADATYNSDLVTALAGLFSPRVDTNVGQRPTSPSKRKGGGGLEAVAISGSYRSADSAYLTFPSFAEALARTAILGFSKPYLVSKYPRAGDKALALFQWLYSSKAIVEIEASDWSRGRTRSGRKLNRLQLTGEGSPKRASSLTMQAADNELCSTTTGAASRSLAAALVDALLPPTRQNNSNSLQSPQQEASSPASHDGDRATHVDVSQSRSPRSFSMPSRRTSTLASVNTEKDRRIARSGMDTVTVSWRLAHTSPPQSSKPSAETESLCYSDDSEYEKPKRKNGIPPPPARPATLPVAPSHTPASPRADTTPIDVTSEQGLSEVASITHLAHALGLSVGRPGSPGDDGDHGNTATSPASQQQAAEVHTPISTARSGEDAHSSLVDPYEMSVAQHTEVSNASSSGVRSNIITQQGFRVTNVEYDYTVASTKISGLGAAGPAARFALAFEESQAHEADADKAGRNTAFAESKSTEFDGSGKRLFAPGEVKHYARNAAGRMLLQKQQDATKLRSPTSRMGGLQSFMSKQQQQTPGILSAVEDAAAPADPALATVHRTDFVKTFAAPEQPHTSISSPLGTTITATGERTRSTSPRLRTAERATQKQGKREFENALAKAVSMKSEPANASMLRNLQVIMKEHGIDDYDLPGMDISGDVMAGVHSIPENVSVKSITDNRAVASPLAERNGRNKKAQQRGLMVRLPSGATLDLEAARSPLAGDVVRTWKRELRSPKTTISAASATKARTSRPQSSSSSTPSTRKSTTTPSSTGIRHGSWLARLAEETESQQQQQFARNSGKAAYILHPVEPAMVSTSMESSNGEKTLISTLSFRGKQSPVSVFATPQDVKAALSQV